MAKKAAKRKSKSKTSLFEAIDPHSTLPALSSRDIKKHDLALGFFPFMEEIQARCGNLSFEMVARHQDPNLVERVLFEFLNSEEELENPPLDGANKPFRNITARRYFANWLCHQTDSGGFKSWHASLPETFRKKHSVNRRRAHFLAKSIRQSLLRTPELSYDWPSTLLNARQGLEGSIRAHSGRLFEQNMRDALQEALSEEGIDLEPSKKEEIVPVYDEHGNLKEGEFLKLDILVPATNIGKTLVVPCKSSLINSTNHSALYAREVLTSIIKAGYHPDDVIIAFGGPGWQKEIQDTPCRTVWIVDAEYLDPEDYEPGCEETPFGRAVQQFRDTFPDWLRQLSRYASESSGLDAA